MSTIPSPDYIINDLIVYRLVNNFDLAVLALLFYEHIITLEEEVVLFWRRKFGGASTLFFVNRYVCLLATVLRSPFLFDSFTYNHPQVCHNFVVAAQVVDVSVYLPWATFSALRVYALSEKTLSIAVVVFTLSCAPFVVNLVRIAWFQTFQDIIRGCDVNIVAPQSTTVPLIIMTRVCVIAADTIVIIIIAIAAFKTRQLRRMAARSRLSFLDLLILDGSMSFVVLLFLNIIHLTLTLLQVNTIYNGGGSLVTELTNPITIVLTSRSLFNLQRLNKRVTEPTLTDIAFCTGTKTVDTMRFGQPTNHESTTHVEELSTCTEEAVAGVDPRSGGSTGTHRAEHEVYTLGRMQSSHAV